MKRIASLLIVLSMTAACDNDDDDNIVVDPAPPTQTTLTEPVLETPTVAPVLVGQTFTTPCLSTEMAAVPFDDLTSSNRVLVFGQSDEFSSRSDFFLGDTCGDSPYLTYEISGTYADLGEATDLSYNNLDILVTDAFLTVQAERQLITFNANSFCGKSDWVLGERVSLTTVNCGFIAPKAGATVAEIYAFEDDKLFLGNNLSFDSPSFATRPSGLNRDISYATDPLK